MEIIKAYPTVYKGCSMRSRLEARWAAFFDLCGWKWTYEPFDLNGYSPDFMLHFKTPMIAEVKPCIHPHEFSQHTPKVESSGWDGEAIILGASFYKTDTWDAAGLGLMSQAGEKSMESYDGPCWSSAVFQKCTNCGEFSFFHEEWTWRCATNDCYEGDHFLNPIDLDTALGMWNRASSYVQWHPN